MGPVVRRSIRANFSFTLAGSMTYAICQWLMISLVTKSGNGEHLNNLVAALAATAPVIVFCNLQLRVIQALDAKGRYLFGDFLTLRLAAQVISLLTLGGWALFSGFNEAAFAAILLVGVNRAIFSIGETFYGAQQRAERMDGIAASMALKGILSITFFWYALSQTQSLSLALISWGAGHFLLLAFDAQRAIAVGVQARSLLPSANFGAMRSLVLEGLPLGLSGVLIALQINIPTYSMMASDYKEEVGAFGAIVMLAAVGRKIIEAATRATGPRLASILGSGRVSRFRQLRFRLALCAGLVGILGLLVNQAFGKEILRFVYTERFVTYVPVLSLICVGEAANFAALALEHALLAGRKFRAQAYTLSASIIVIASTSPFLIPEHGVVGAGWAVLLGGLARLSVSTALTLRFDRRTSPHAECSN